MIETVGLACLGVHTVAMFAALYRIVRGPSVADRAVAADELTTVIMAVVVVSSIVASTRAYFDAVMAMAVLGFFGSVAIAKYLIGGRPIE